MSKVLVSGAGGYIGVPLCAKLLERNHSVIALDRYFFGKDRIDALADNAQLSIVAEDVRDFDPTILSGVEAVIDLAGLSNDASAEINPELTRDINMQGGMRLVK